MGSKGLWNLVGAFIAVINLFLPSSVRTINQFWQVRLLWSRGDIELCARDGVSEYVRDDRSEHARDYYVWL